MSRRGGREDGRSAALAPASGIQPGALNLLERALGLGAGQRLLIVAEPDGTAIYDREVGDTLAAAARRLGAETAKVVVPLPAGPEHLPGALTAAIVAADRVLFLSRIGDQVRFSRIPGLEKSVIAYTLTTALLEGWFGRLPHRFLTEIHDRFQATLDAARTYRIRSPAGTDLAGSLASGLPAGEGVRDFTVRSFPVMIFPPVPAAGASGRLVLTHFLCSTSIHDYGGAILPLPSPLTLTIESGRIVRFDGEPALRRRVEAHFARIGALSGGDPARLFSWHAGINPATAFPGAALDAIDRWSSVAFGSPRYAHFHLCGRDPGDICGQVFDATIELDGEAYWRDGRFLFLQRQENAALAAACGVPPEVLTTVAPIGIS
ncbi:MAG: hypothetical protein U1E53_27765 [Dongiaceae bacterium]